MKTILAAAFLILSGHALAASTLMSFSTSVYFAPPAMRGTSGVKLLDNGQLVSFTNKGVETELAQFSPEVLKAIEAKITALKVVPLSIEEGPRCMDAPSSKLEVTLNNTAVVIYQRQNCRDAEMSGAEELVSLGKALRTLNVKE